MTYYVDMSLYEYIEECVRPNTFNVGWLSRDYDFERGKSPEQFHQRLLEFCAFGVCKTRGWHICEFCNTEERAPIKVEFNADTILFLGSAEIRIIGDDKIFASPNLIYHYVVAHEYLPPQEFIDAVLESPLPTSDEYKQQLRGLV
ncbi:MAG: hypothetical protein HZB19_11945 [Chloroflexi bacterium]|nr:hypothetical protein [Chloroflexota bacterium]